MRSRQRIAVMVAVAVVCLLLMAPRLAADVIGEVGPAVRPSARRREVRHYDAAPWRDRQRMVWVSGDCEPSSQFRSAEPAVVADYVAIVGNASAATSDGCFFFASGRWSTPLDPARLRADADDADRVLSLSSCSAADLLAPEYLRWMLSGTGKRLRRATLQHARCHLPNVSDPYALLVLLTAARRALPYPVLELVGDSLHRNLFATLVALLRGVGAAPHFDRQSKASLLYVLYPHGDWVGAPRHQVSFADAMLVMRFTGTFLEPTWVKSTIVSMPPKPVSAVVVGGSMHIDGRCPDLVGMKKHFAGYAAELSRYVHRVAHTVIVKAGALTNLTQPHGELSSFYAWKNHVYRGLVTHVRRDAAGKNVYFLDDVALLNTGHEAGAALDEALQAADRVHFTCVMRGDMLHEPVTEWKLLRRSCRGWHDRANVALLAAMLVAAVRA